MKLPHDTIVRAPALLPMYYKPSEIAQELNLALSTLYDWLEAGAPHQRDDSNHIWIDGRKLADWVEENRKKKAVQHKLMDDQAYCFNCKQPVKLTDSTTIPGKGRLFFIKGICPTCSNIIVRGGSKNDRAL